MEILKYRLKYIYVRVVQCSIKKGLYIIATVCRWRVSIKTYVVFGWLAYVSAWIVLRKLDRKEEKRGEGGLHSSETEGRRKFVGEKESSPFRPPSSLRPPWDFQQLVQEKRNNRVLEKESTLRPFQILQFEVSQEWAGLVCQSTNLELGVEVNTGFQLQTNHDKEKEPKQRDEDKGGGERSYCNKEKGGRK